MKYEKDSTTPYLTRWASMGQIFEEYGTFLIKRHPVSFVRYFGEVGLKFFALPPTELLGTYNSGKDSVSSQVKNWFDYKSTKIRSFSKKIYSVSAYPIVLSILNVLLILGMSGFVILKIYTLLDFKSNRAFQLVIFYWLTTFLFGIFSAPTVLRYQLPKMIIEAYLGLILIELIYKADQLKSLTSNKTPDAKLDLRYQ